jgi:ethanolamine utilization protein EutA
MAKELILTSVGIDIGTTTTQLVVSRLTLVNVMPGCQVPKIEITHKSIVYMGNVYFTPFLDRQRVDGLALRKIIAKEYAAAGIQPSDIDTGAVIITGETAKKDNASEIIHSLAEYAGDFVVATAGPDLESVIAGKGSGAEAISRRLHMRIANLDIGGGTSNIAVFDHGKCIGTACVNVGGRLFEVDTLTHRLSYIAPPAQYVADILSRQRREHFFPTPSREQEMQRIQACLNFMVHCVDNMMLRETLTREEQTLVMSCQMPDNRPQGIVFSGGVARYIYQPGQREWWIHSDVGPLLAERFRRSKMFQTLTVHQGTETLHATVLGAGAHTVNVSGSTITISKGALPLRNIPVVYPTQRTDGMNTWLEPARHFSSDLYRTVALVIPPLPNTDFITISTLAQQLAIELQQLPGVPKVVVAQQDIAKVLGQSIIRNMPGQDLICLDSIELKMGDFLDIAKPLPHEEAVPVIVKTLVFVR